MLMLLWNLTALCADRAPFADASQAFQTLEARLRAIGTDRYLALQCGGAQMHLICTVGWVQEAVSGLSAVSVQGAREHTHTHARMRFAQPQEGL